MSKVKWTNKKIVLIAIGVIAVLFIGVSLFRILGSEGEQDLTVYSVYQVRETDPLLFDGMVQAEQEQEEYVDPSLGVIAEIEVEDGEKIEAGEVMFSYTNEENQQLLDEQNRLHSRSSNRLSETEADLANAQSDLQTAEANIEETNRQIENHAPSEDAEFGLDQELESLQSDRAGYEADKAEAEASIESAQMTIRELEEQLEDTVAEIERIRENITTTVEASVSGVVELDESVSRSEVLEQPLVRILSDTIIVEATVSEYDYEELSVGAPVEVLLMNSDRIVNGEITTIASTPLGLEGDDSSSRYAFMVLPEESIQYGFSVQVSYQDGSIHLPESALIMEEDGTYVFLHEGGTVKRREVSVLEAGSTFVLEDGVSVGEEIVLDPLPELEDGETIVIVDD